MRKGGGVNGKIRTWLKSSGMCFETPHIGCFVKQRACSASHIGYPVSGLVFLVEFLLVFPFVYVELTCGFKIQQ